MTKEKLSPLDTMMTVFNMFPSLRAILSLFDEPEKVFRFTQLVEEYLPDRRDEIMSLSESGDRIANFIYHFSERYFELSESWVQSIWEGGYSYDDDEEMTLYDGLICFIPVETHGFNYDDLHYLDNHRPGYLMALSLLSLSEDNSAKVAIIDALKGILGEKLATSIPLAGFSHSTIRELVEGTKYVGLGDLADWYMASTGCFILDYDEENAYFDMPPWDRGEVERLIAEQSRAKAKAEKWGQLYKWLEEKPQAHFKELLDHLTRKKDGADNTLYETFLKEEADGNAIEAENAEEADRRLPQL